MKVLEGKAALVTGSARGIGRAAAALLVEHGASVHDRRPRRGPGAARRRLELGGDDGGLRRRPDEGRRLRGARGRRRSTRSGKLDIVVNNAGYTWDGIAHKMSDDQFRAMLEIHTVVPFQILRPPRRTSASRPSRRPPRDARSSARS